MYHPTLMDKIKFYKEFKNKMQEKKKIFKRLIIEICFINACSVQ